MKYFFIIIWKRSSARESSDGQVPEAWMFLKCLWKSKKVSVAERKQTRGRMGGDEIRPDQEFVGPYRPLQFGILAFSHSQITGLWRVFF